MRGKKGERKLCSSRPEKHSFRFTGPPVHSRFLYNPWQRPLASSVDSCPQTYCVKGELRGTRGHPWPACEGVGCWTHVLLVSWLPFSQVKAAELFPASSFLGCKVLSLMLTLPPHITSAVNLIKVAAASSAGLLARQTLDRPNRGPFPLPCTVSFSLGLATSPVEL